TRLTADALGVGRIDGRHLRIAGRDVETIVPEGRPAAEGAAAHPLGFEIDLPNPAAGAGVERADLHVTIHRENPAAGDYGLRKDASTARGALADAGLPSPCDPVR